MDVVNWWLILWQKTKSSTAVLSSGRYDVVYKVGKSWGLGMLLLKNAAWFQRVRHHFIQRVLVIFIPINIFLSVLVLCCVDPYFLRQSMQ